MEISLAKRVKTGENRWEKEAAGTKNAREYDHVLSSGVKEEFETRGGVTGKEGKVNGYRYCYCLKHRK